jgi:hypothetical protein
MTNKSMKKFWMKVKEENEIEYSIACNSYRNFDEEAEVEKALKNGDFNTNHPIVKRVATRDSQNIEMMFSNMQKEKVEKCEKKK